MLSRPRLAALCALWMATTAVAVPALAEGKATVVVTPGSEQLYRAAIQRFADLSPTPAAKRVAVFRDALESALEYSGVFKSLDLKAFLGPEATEALEGGPPVICSDSRCSPATQTPRVRSLSITRCCSWREASETSPRAMWARRDW